MALQDQAKSQIKGLAARIGSGLVGLFVAGGLMWFTPLIDRYVKPSKPLANFATEELGEPLVVTFKNLSQNAMQTRWDFGDGTPLEIHPGTVTEVKHKFKKPNSYRVKLTVLNVANQEDSRENLVAVGMKPQILDLSMKPVNQKTKPYTAGVKVKFEATADMDAQLEWDFGDGIYHVHHEAVVHEFPLPGKHLIKVRAVLGHQKGAPTVQEIEVLPASGLQTASYNTPSNSPAPASGATSVELTLRSLLSPEAITRERMQVVNLQGKVSGSELKEYVRAAPGYKIHSVKLDGFTLRKSANVINESVTTAEDGKSAVVRAQLTQPGQEYSFHVAVQYVETVDPSAMKENQAVVTLPGVTSSLELPLGVKHEFELKYHGQTILKQQELPLRASEFTIDGRSYAVTCTKSGNRATFTFRSIPHRLQ